MKNIKFRGKPTENNTSYIEEEFVYGSLVISNGKYYITLNVNDNINRDDYEVYMIGVIPETVGQYTGLKDKNGKEIYEGDIVRKCNVNYIVMFDPQGYWCLDGNGALNSEMLSSELPHFEVIGNIYESEVEDEKINC